MHREHDEEDEIQEVERLYDGRPYHVTQHRRKGLPVYEDNSFSKRLGPRSKSVLRDRGIERKPASISADAPRRTLMDEIPRSLRSSDVVKVNPRCCGFPCASNHNDSQKTSRLASGSRELPTRTFKTKESKSLGAILTRKFFRSKNNDRHPPWENEWTLIREELELEMKQMREVHQSVQEICQELKRMGFQREDPSNISSRGRPLSGAVFNRDDELGHSKGHGILNYAHARENGYHQSNLRAKSAPRTRVTWDSDLSEEDSEHTQIPSAALFKEVIREKRVHLQKLVSALVKYEENRFLTDDFEFQEESNSLHILVTRLFPHANFANDWHFKYGIEAWLSRVVFNERQKSEERDRGARAMQYAWEEYQRLSRLRPIDAIRQGEDHCPSFCRFFNVKFDTIRNELKWLEEWPDGLVADLQEASKHVWRARNLANAFDPVASLFIVKTSDTFDPRLMEPLETPCHTDDLIPPTTQLGFLVSPGYFVCDRIIKCQVCLAPYYSLDSL